MRKHLPIGFLLLSSALPAHAQPLPEDPHAGHDMSAMPGMEMPDSPAPAPQATEPASPADHVADRLFDPAEMAAARARLRKEHGGVGWQMVRLDLAEYQLRKGRDGYRWAGEASFGGDLNRLVVKSEGEGDLGRTIGHAEVQALYARAVGPYFNLRAGVRHDFRPQPSRTYATIGFEGLAPYWLEVEGGLFLSDKGDLLGRIETHYDQRLTQRLILQPRAELNFAAQDVPENGIGGGLCDVELGLRLRYEIVREFAPYIGVSHERKTGNTADFARAAGDGASSTSFIAGIRAWF